MSIVVAGKLHSFIVACNTLVTMIALSLAVLPDSAMASGAFTTLQTHPELGPLRNLPIIKAEGRLRGSAMMTIYDRQQPTKPPQIIQFGLVEMYLSPENLVSVSFESASKANTPGVFGSIIRYHFTKDMMDEGLELPNATIPPNLTRLFTRSKLRFSGFVLDEIPALANPAILSQSFDSVDVQTTAGGVLLSFSNVNDWKYGVNRVEWFCNPGTHAPSLIRTYVDVPRHGLLTSVLEFSAEAPNWNAPLPKKCTNTFYQNNNANVPFTTRIEVEWAEWTPMAWNPDSFYYPKMLVYDTRFAPKVPELRYDWKPNQTEGDILEELRKHEARVKATAAVEARQKRNRKLIISLGAGSVVLVLGLYWAIRRNRSR